MSIKKSKIDLLIRDRELLKKTTMLGQLKDVCLEYLNNEITKLTQMSKEDSNENSN